MGQPFTSLVGLFTVCQLLLHVLFKLSEAASFLVFTCFPKSADGMRNKMCWAVFRFLSSNSQVAGDTLNI